jgi:hypothetical protein
MAETFQMTTLRSAVILSLLVAAQASSQTRRSAAMARRPPVGLLIGFGEPEAGNSSSTMLPADGDTARSDLVRSSVDTLPDGSRIRHLATDDRADPFSTLWLLVRNGRVAGRAVQHIIVPRRNGFWWLGTNMDSAYRPSTDSVGDQWEAPFAVRSFFWLAPLGQAPALRHIAAADVTCYSDVSETSLTYVGPDYLGYTAFRSGVCTHYDESTGMSVEGLDSTRAANERNEDAALTPVARLGAAAVVLHARLDRAAKRWDSECGTRGYEGNPAAWTIRRAGGRWQVIAGFYGTGGGVCGRYSVERALDVPLPGSVVSPEPRLPIPWGAITKVVRGAVDATASPDGSVVVVFEREQATVMAVEGKTLLALGKPISLPDRKVVMLEWAIGASAERWNEVVSALPALPEPRVRAGPR